MIKFRAWDSRYKEYIKDVLIENSGNIYFDDGVATQDDLDIRIEQFTGLKDVNGKEIYEGDIIITHPKYDDEQSNSGVVQYGCSHRPEFSYKSQNGKYMSIWSSNIYRTYEVIGNVHTTPELSEVDNNAN